MASYVICKNCGKKIFANRPSGNVQTSGNVQYSGVQFDGNSIKFGSGGRVNFGQNGKISFGNSLKSDVKCPKCGVTLTYSINDFR